MQLFGPPDVTKLEAKKDVKGLVKALGYEKDWGTREKAAKALGQIGDNWAAEALIAALKDSDKDVRRAAATALGKIGDLRAVEPLIAALKDSDRYVRIAAADALGQLRDDRAVDPLISGLIDPEPIVREAFVKALGLIGEPRAAEALKALLKDRSKYVRPVAANALDQIGWGPDHGESSAWFWIHTENWEKAAEFGYLAVEPLLFALENDYSRPNRHIERQDSYLSEWGQAAKALVKIGDQAVEPLIIALNDADLRWYAIEALKGLGEIGDPRVIQSLSIILENGARKPPGLFTEEDEHWCTQVVKGLGKIGDPRTVALLIPFLRKGKNDWLMSMAARDALVHIGDPAVEPLINILIKLDEREDLRFCVAQVLGKMGDTRAVMPLISVLKEKEDAIRYYATEALGNIGDPRAVKPLTSMLEDKAEHVRKVAVVALEKFDDSLAKEVLAPLRKKEVPQRSEGFKMDGQFAIYKLNQTCLGNPLELKAKTEKFCIYCQQLRDPNLRASENPRGMGECDYGVHSLDDTCEHWEPNYKVRFWLSKGYMEHNLEGWPKKPWYQVFDDGPDGKKSTS